MERLDIIEIKLDLLMGTLANQTLAFEMADSLRIVEEQIQAANKDGNAEKVQELMERTNKMKELFVGHKKAALEAVTLYNNLFGEASNKRFEELLEKVKEASSDLKTEENDNQDGGEMIVEAKVEASSRKSEVG